MKIAIQESSLPGETILQKMKTAQKIGIEGIEVSSDGLHTRNEEVLGAMEATGVRIAAVNAGATHLLHPEFSHREKALVTLRTAMTDALDIGADGVVFIPHYSTSAVLPDLRPYKSAIEMEGELLVAQLRATLTDLAYALGSQLYMLAVSKQRAHLINTLYQAYVIRDKIDHHPHLTLAAELCDMQSEEDDPVGALVDYGAHLGYVHIADTSHRLPGHGDMNFNTILSALKMNAYDGWLTLTCNVPNIDDPTYVDDLSASVAMLNAAMS
ncbi:MAG: sugar phosphate isomerase/epimerase [Aggregatilineales bacterium]